MLEKFKNNIKNVIYERVCYTMICRIESIDGLIANGTCKITNNDLDKCKREAFIIAARNLFEKQLRNENN
jgi:hypothetical protein